MPREDGRRVLGGSGGLGMVFKRGCVVIRELWPGAGTGCVSLVFLWRGWYFVVLAGFLVRGRGVSSFCFCANDCISGLCTDLSLRAGR